MPYPLQFLDYYGTGRSATGVDTAARKTLIVLPVGSNFQPGDMRVALVRLYFAASSGTVSWTFDSLAGWTKVHDSLYDLGSSYSSRIGIFISTLNDTSTDATLKVSYDGYFYVGANMVEALTVRNPKLAQSWTAVANTVVATNTSLVAPSIPTADGALLCSWAVQYSTQSLAAPSPMTTLGYTPQEDSSATWSLLLAGQSYTGSGTSGTKVMTLGTSVRYTATSLFLYTNPDVTVSLGTANESDTGGVVTGSLLNKTTKVVDTAFETDAGFQIFSPLTGFRISDPQAMPGTPITASRITWQATTYAPGSTVTVETSINGGATWQTPLNGGAVPNLTSGNTSVRTILTRTTLTRANGGDPTPRAQFLRVEVSTDSAADEMVPLGMFVINEARVTTSSGGAGSGGTWVEVSGVDLSRVISRNSWDDVYFVTAGTNYATAIQEMIANRLPGTSFNFASTEHVTPRLLFGTKQGNDPWQDAQDLATAIGYELFFDAAGVCTLRQIPDPAVANSVWKFTDDANPTIASVTRTLSDVTTFNKVIAQGEATANVAPVTASAIDNDPASPTYYKGPYGTVPVYFTSPMITTTAQAQAAADAILLAVKGASETVELSMVPMPALEPGDVVTVTVGDSKITGTFLVNQTTIPLSAATAMTATCYRQA